MTRKSIVAALAIAVFAFLAFAALNKDKNAPLARQGYWGDDAQWAEHSKMIGQPAPKLELTDAKGTIPTAAAMKDKIVVVDFWATWCPPCKAAIPHNNEIAKSYAAKGVLVIGACGGGGEEKMWGLAEQLKIEYPTGKASEEMSKAWGVQWWPHYVVIDRKGIIRAIGIQPEFVGKVIDELIGEEGKK